jgi:hypothetical protein
MHVKLFRRRATSAFAKGVLFASTLWAAFLAGGASREHGAPPGTIEGTTFRLVDQNGIARGAWTVHDNTVDLSLLDTKGRVRTAITVDDHPVIKFLGEGGDDGVIISQHQARGSGLALFDQLGKARIQLAANKALTTAALMDGDGRTRLGGFCDVIGNADIALQDAQGKALWAATGRGVAPKDK